MSNIIDSNSIDPNFDFDKDVLNATKSARILAEERMLEHKGIVRTARDIERLKKLMDDFAPIVPGRMSNDIFARKIFTGNDRNAIQKILGKRIHSDIKKLNEYIHSDRAYNRDLMEEETELKIENYKTKARQKA